MFRFFRYILVLTVAFLCVSARQVRADTVDLFTYQSGALVFQWQLPASPTALESVIDAFSFSVATEFTENGAVMSGSISFFNGDPAVGGGLEINDAGLNLLANAFGPQVYSGNENAPTFVPGTYTNLTDFAVDPNGTPAALTIEEVQVAPVPEPSTVLLLGSGIFVLALGSLLKKAAT